MKRPTDERDRRDDTELQIVPVSYDIDRDKERREAEEAVIRSLLVERLNSGRGVPPPLKKPPSC